MSSASLTFADRLLRRGMRWFERLQKRAQQIEVATLQRRIGHVGADVQIHGPLRLTGPECLRLDDNVHIMKNATIRAEGGISIGANTHIAQNACIYSINHRFRNADCIPYDEQLEKRPVTIGRNVWIGINVVIAPGTTIGDGAIIGMGTVVSGDVPELAIIGSQKWRQIGTRDAAEYERLEAAGRYGGVNGYLYEPADGPSSLTKTTGPGPGQQHEVPGQPG